MDYSIDPFISPDPDQFSSMDGWTDLGNERFMAVCYRFVLVRRRSDAPLDGPLVNSITIPVNSDYTLSTEEVTTETFTDEIQSTVENAFAIKTSAELSTKLSTKVKASVNPSAEIATELLAELAVEIADSVKQSLAATSSYSISVSKTNSDTLVLKAGNGGTPATRKFNAFIKVWEWTWDFYLYDIQHLSLKYAKRRRHFFWSDISRTIEKSGSDNPVRQSLFSLIFYEPTGSISVVEGDYEPAIANARARRVSELTKQFPDSGMPQKMRSLEAYAKLAFPTTPEEEKAAKQAHPAPRPATRSGGRRHVPAGDHAHAATPTTADTPITRSVGKWAAARKGVKAAGAQKVARKPAAKVVAKVSSKKAIRAAVAKRATQSPRAGKKTRSRTARPTARK